MSVLSSNSQNGIAGTDMPADGYRKWSEEDEKKYTSKLHTEWSNPPRDKEPECLADWKAQWEKRDADRLESARIERLGERYKNMRKVLAANKPLGLSDYIAAQSFMIQMEILAQLEETNAMLRAVYFNEDDAGSVA